MEDYGVPSESDTNSGRTRRGPAAHGPAGFGRGDRDLADYDPADYDTAGFGLPDQDRAGFGPPGRGRRRGLAAPLALPAGFGALLVVGAIAAGTHGWLSSGWVLALAAVIVGCAAAVSEPAVAPVIAGIGWLTVVGFSHAPYAQLQPGGRHGLIAAAVVGGCAAAGLGTGLVLRRVAASFTLWIVDVPGELQPGQDGPASRPGKDAPAPRQDPPAPRQDTPAPRRNARTSSKASRRGAPASRKAAATITATPAGAPAARGWRADLT